MHKEKEEINESSEESTKRKNKKSYPSGLVIDQVTHDRKDPG